MTAALSGVRDRRGATTEHPRGAINGPALLGVLSHAGLRLAGASLTTTSVQIKSILDRLLVRTSRTFVGGHG